MSMLTLSKSSLLHVLKSLLADELKALRHLSDHDLDTTAWDETTLIHGSFESADGQGAARSLNADSMEVIALATRVNTCFQLHESGLEDYLLRYKTLGDWVTLVATARDRGARNLAFTTSGSTGTPKVCVHRWETLVEEAAFFARYFEDVLDDRLTRVVALAPCHHIYGFIFTVLVPQLLELPVVRGQQALALAQARRLQGGDVVVGFPFVWQQLSRQALRFPEKVLGLTSTGASDPEIIRLLRRQGLTAMVEIYGSSETAGVGARVDADESYRLLPRWRREDVAENELRDDRNHHYALADDLHWLDDRHFHPRGRKDEAVQVGGVNVYPGRIARLLESLPQVARAQVRLMTHEEGGRLKAFVVPSTPLQAAGALTEKLTQWCRMHLTAPETPRVFTFGENLPTGAMGKPGDWEL
ncbi:4-coumarate--CoA ligase, photoactive yellow protein activation family [Modicisalibacter ilicicola DSM 19980]|uniref:4-coumarate--CoA ligase, photoactive yellow protein activation family n=1 Tax=Modicisalibacter ilicicola DSM 19980 TaxID=1121942 RepID=A0A1M4SR58_9GAMM|nr:AMP-binding protein [Halomonas ilicicola]SHE34734.1 4-coumarate--CoA ligase, photoactive yellow protein activation family [Halomonas ilicicola DSM 19980]